MARGSIKPRGNSYRIRVDYRDAYGNRRQVSKTASSNRQAEKLRTQLLAEIDKDSFVKPSKLTVKTHLEEWLNGSIRSTVSPKTHELYAYLSRKHLIPALGAIPLSQLRAQHIQALYSEKLSSLSPRTIQLLHVCLHKALDNAIKTGLLVKNPLDVVDVPKVEHHNMKTMTEDDIKLFLNEARKGEYHTLFFVLLYTGMRRGEALSLCWSDIDLPGAQLSINKTMQFLHNEITFKSTKTTSSRRQIDISPRTGAMLRLHREAQNNIRQQTGLAAVADSDLVFCHYGGKPYLPNTITHAWIKLTRRCGLNGIRLHDARHSHASLMLKSGTSPKVIQERLGHSSFSTTMNLYAHVSPGMQKQAAMRFDEMITDEDQDNSVTIP